MVRDPDIGTDQECFACDGSGIDQFTHPTPDDASADTARLDWLEQEDEMGFFYNIDHITANINEGFNGCKTLREAIDAAIDRARQSGEEGK
jgi:hypothetical protein